MGHGAMISGLGVELGALNLYVDYHVETYQFLRATCQPSEPLEQVKLPTSLFVLTTIFQHLTVNMKAAIVRPL